MLGSIKRFLPYLILIALSIRFFIMPDGLHRLWSAASPLLGTLFIIYLLQPIVNFIQEKLHAKRIIALLLSYFLLLSITFLFFYALIPGIYQSVLHLLPHDYDAFVSRCCENPLLLRYVGAERTRTFLYNVPSMLTEYMDPLLHYSTDLLSSLSSLIKYIGIAFIALTMSFYALLESKDPGSSIAAFIYHTFSVTAADLMLSLLDIIDTALRRFIQGKMIACLILGIGTTLLLLLCNLLFDLSIPYAGLLGFLIALTNIIPYIGPLLGTVVCVLLSLFHGWVEALAVLGVVLLMQQVDNMYLEPRILGDSTGVSPFWVLTSVTCFGIFWGGIGMILAVPIASILRQMIVEYQRYQYLKHRGVPVSLFENVPEKWRKFRPV